MASPSIPGPIVRQPSSPALVGTGERRAQMETSFDEDRQPSIQVMDSLEHSIDEDQEGSSDKKKIKTKRNSIRIIITRIFSAILIIADCVFDWLQYYQIITTPLDIISEIIADDEDSQNNAYSNNNYPFNNYPYRNYPYRNFPNYNYQGFQRGNALQQTTEPPASNSTLFCISDVGEIFMYFTIAGTVLSLIQLANIIFQIYSEVEYLKKKKQFSEDNEETPKKILDGRTETLYSVLFIEIPQGILLLMYQDACLPSVGKTLKCKRLKQRTWAVVNGGIALLNNAFRYITCSKCCEEDIEDSTCGWCRVACGKYMDCISSAREKCVVCAGSYKPKSKKPKKSIDCFSCFSGAGGKCGGSFWSLLTCFFPCLCFFSRYESPMLCGICGKKCIIDKCKCSTEPWSYKLSVCGFCFCHYCPLVDPDDPEGGGQKCCDVTGGSLFKRYECPMLCCLCGNKCVIDKCKCSTEPWSYKLSLCGLCNFHLCPLINPDDPEGGGQKCCDVTIGLCKCSDGTCFDGKIGCCECSVGKCCDATGVSCNCSDGKCAVTIGCCEWSTGNCCAGTGTCSLKCPECFKSAYGKFCGGTDDFLKCSNACSNPFDYEPLTCNLRLGLIVNIGYLVFYFYNVLKMLCIL
ncbi:uncharacterized protein LOC134714474 isoform X2 [Mytilus trossulus]|uniref:uncharacterized protein LOC134714474 isoform X2 n=1 Tax=Mytilus trossulus TaxID=6551 RepID=UPI00300481B6